MDEWQDVQQEAYADMVEWLTKNMKHARVVAAAREEAERKLGVPTQFVDRMTGLPMARKPLPSDAVAVCWSCGKPRTSVRAV